MISFRYHLVSIVAVFLALALGVVMGTTVVKQGVIEQLRSRTDAAVKTTHLLQQEVNQLRTDVNTWEKFSTEAQPILVTSQLSGEQVVMVTIQGVDLPEVDGVRRALQQSGATVVGILEATSRMALTDSRAQSDMAAVLGVNASPRALRWRARIRSSSSSTETSSRSSEARARLRRWACPVSCSSSSQAARRLLR